MHLVGFTSIGQKSDPPVNRSPDSESQRSSSHFDKCWGLVFVVNGRLEISDMVGGGKFEKSYSLESGGVISKIQKSK